MLDPAEFITLPADFAPTLVVVVDTEEEFEWGKGFRREANTVRAMAEIGVFQRVCDEFGIVPTYVVDYPVATQEIGRAELAGFQGEQRAAIGAHLHPWVNPPHEEEPGPANSYAGNLPEQLERSKIVELAEAIEAGFGARPRVYKAGRYGVGDATARILEQEGFEVDLSICPTMDYRADGGPDFTGRDARSHWFGRSRRLLEIPVAGGFAGVLRARHAMLATPVAQRLRLTGICSRLRLLERGRLTPEGFSCAQNMRLARAMVADGIRILQFSLHSPSMAVGYTPYVRSRADRAALLDTCRRFFEFFLGELSGRARTPLEVKRELEGARESESERSID